MRTTASAALLATVSVAGFPAVTPSASAAVPTPAKTTAVAIPPLPSAPLSAPAAEAPFHGDFSNPPVQALAVPAGTASPPLTQPAGATSSMSGPQARPARPVSGFQAGKSVEQRAERTANTKTFENPDGTQSRQVASVPIHYWDGSGWQDIDDTIVADSARPGVLRNKANGFVARFAPLGQGVSLDADGASFVMKPRGAAATVRPAVESDGSVLYQNAWPGVDLRYRVQNDRVKEEIVVRHVPATNTFGFTIIGDAVTSSADGALSFAGPLAGKWQIVPPVVLDRNGAAVAAAEAHFDISDGGHTVGLAVDPAWWSSLTAADLPIVIDPTARPIALAGDAHRSKSYSNLGGVCDPCSIHVGLTGGAAWRSTVFFDYSNGGTFDLHGSMLTNAQIELKNRVDGGPVFSTWMDAYETTTWDWGSAGQHLAQATSDNDFVFGGPNSDLQLYYQGLLDNFTDNRYAKFIINEVPNSYKDLQYFLLTLTWNRPPTNISIAAPSPGDGARVFSQSATLAATASDPNGDQLFYTYQVSTDPGFGSLAASCTNPSPNQCPVTLAWNDAVHPRYYWRALVNDGYLPGNVTGPTWSFVLDGPTDAGTPEAPANGTTIATLTPTLKADPHNGDPLDATTYWFKVGTSSSFAPETILYDSGWFANPGQHPFAPMPSNKLVDGGTYWWEVLTRDGDGHYADQYSTPATFKVNLRLGEQPASPWDRIGPVSVNLATGNLLTTVNSATLPTEGGPLGVSFVYNSRTPTVMAGSALPAGWSVSVDTDAALSYDHLAVNGPTLTLVEPTGATHPYQQTSSVAGAKSWTALDDDDAVVTQNGDESYTVFAHDGLTYRFDAGGHLQTATTANDRPGAAGAQPYDQRDDPQYWWDGASGRLTKISDRLSGRYLQLSYAGVGPAACDTTGYSTPPGNSLCRIQYYDNTGGLLFETKLFFNSSGDLASIVNPGGETTSFGYAAGPTGYVRQISDVTDPLANDAMSTIPAQRTPGDPNVRTRIDYFTTGNRVGWVSGVTSPLPTTVTGDVRPHRTYDPTVPDANGYATTTDVHIDGSAQPNTYSRRITVNGLGQMTTELDANAKTTSWQWLSDDRPQWSDDATLKRISTIYDVEKRPTDTYGPEPTSCFTGDTPTQPVPGGCPNPPIKAGKAYDGATTFADGSATNTPVPAMHGLDIAYWRESPITSGPPVGNAFVGDAVSHEFLSPGSVFTKTWTPSTPPPGISANDHWLARLTGEIVTPTSLQLQVVADDGVRVYLDDNLVYDWWGCPPAGQTGGCPNTGAGYPGFTTGAGVHRIRIEYYQETGPASLTLVCSYGCSGTLPLSYLNPRYDLVTSTRDADGKRTATVYYDESVTPAVPNPERGLPGQTISDPGGLNLTTTMTYEKAGNPNSYGRLASKAMPNGATTTFTYYNAYPSSGGGTPDPCGDPNTPFAQNGGPATVTHPSGVNGQLEDYTAYDRVGRVMANSSSTSPSDPWNCTHYDDRSRPTWTQDRTGKQTNVNYTGLVTTTTYPDPTLTDDIAPCVDPGVDDGLCKTISEVDLLGRPYRYTDENGTRTTSKYDQAGRLIETDRQYGPLDTNNNPTGPTIAPLTTALYDGTSRQTSLTDYSGGVPRTTSFGYDDAGRLTTTTRPNDDATLRAVTTQAIAVDGNMGSVTHQRNSTTLASDTYTRSLAGRITNETGTGTPTRAYTYDGAGRLTKTVEGATTRNYAYDPNSNRCATATTCGTPTLNYDAADHLTSSPYASGYQYDNFGNLRTATGTGGNPNETFVYDGNEHATSIDDGTTKVAEMLSPAGRVLRRTVTTDATGTVTEDTLYGYDGSGDSPAYEQPVTAPLGGTPVLLADNWDSGNWNKWTTTTSGTATVDVQNNKGRLRITGAADAKATGPQVTDAEVSFTYQFSDRNGTSGFRTTLRGTGSPLQSGYRLDVQSDIATVKLRRFSGGANTDTLSFTYTKDTNPQRVRFRAQGGHVQVKIWAAGSPEPTSWQIDWTDPSPIAGSGFLQLHHNGTTGTRDVTVNDLVLSDLMSANVRKTNVAGPAGLLVTDVNGEPTYTLVNAHGDIVGTTDVAGGFTAAPIADEFGRPTTGVPSSRLGWLGANQRYTDQTATGIVRMGVRLYDPNLGRFLSSDPVEGGCSNDYVYVNDPINQFDLDGQKAKSCSAYTKKGNVGYIAIQTNMAGGFVWGAYMNNPKNDFGIWYYDVVLHYGRRVTRLSNENDPTHWFYPPHNQITRSQARGLTSIEIHVVHSYVGPWWWPFPVVARGNLTCTVT